MTSRMRPFYSMKVMEKILVLLCICAFLTINVQHNMLEVYKERANSFQLKSNDVDITSKNNNDNYDNIPHLHSLKCEKYGGPNNDLASEMVYWWKIPSDETFLNPFQRKNIEESIEEKFLIFEPDAAGWNNIRMSLETIVTLAISMGRTIVLPPEKRIYLLWENKSGRQKHHFTFRDFFHLEEVENEHPHLKFISMNEYLTKFAMTGQLKSKAAPFHAKYPPLNRTNWDGSDDKDMKQLWDYIQETSYMDESWKPMDSISYFPQYDTDLGPKRRVQIQDNVTKVAEDINHNRGEYETLSKPFPVGSTSNYLRLRERLAKRNQVCFYDNEMQKAKFVHFKHDWKTGDRFLLPFYAFHYFEDWQQDIWTKRFVRDHLRYNDELMCAAARVVDAIRTKAKAYDPDNNKDGRFHTLHIRRGDFHQQFKGSILPADSLTTTFKSVTAKREHKTIFIATDEKNFAFFEPFKMHYQVLFLGDFMHLLKDVNSNYYPLIDQLISSRGDIFIGTHHSTFTSYINRLRGYYSCRDKLDGYEEGKIDSYYFSQDVTEKHREYFSLHQPFWAYEFPEAWYDIDHDVMKETNV